MDEVRSLKLWIPDKAVENIYLPSNLFAPLVGLEYDEKNPVSQSLLNISLPHVFSSPMLLDLQLDKNKAKVLDLDKSIEDRRGFMLLSHAISLKFESVLRPNRLFNSKSPIDILNYLVDSFYKVDVAIIPMPYFGELDNPMELLTTYFIEGERKESYNNFCNLVCVYNKRLIG